MSDWIESSIGVKFLCWGELKKSIENPDDAVVIKIGEKIEGIVTMIEPVKDDDGNIEQYKMKIKSKKYDVPVLVWSNASIKRQIDDIGINEGDEIQLIYEKDYKAKNGKIGRDVKVRVKKS